MPKIQFIPVLLVKCGHRFRVKYTPNYKGRHKKINLEWDEHDRKTGLSEAKKADLQRDAERRANIKANVDRALVERQTAEFAPESEQSPLIKIFPPEKKN